jgi:hypothetical protein
MSERHLHLLKRRLTALESHATTQLLQQHVQELARRPTALVVAGAVTLATVSLYGGLFDSAFSVERAADAAQQQASEPAAADEAVQGSLAALADRLAKVELDGVRLSISDGRILAVGKLDAAGLETWRDLRTWYDATHGSRVLLVSTVQGGGAATGPDLRIAAVWVGEAPYVLTAGGMRYFEGSILPNNWQLFRISRTAIELRRADDTYLIDLTGGDQPPSLSKG